MGIRFSKNNPVFATQRKTGREVLSSHPVARGKVLFWTLSQKFFYFFFEPAQPLINGVLFHIEHQSNFSDRKSL